jgi:hypothetical protein
MLAARIFWMFLSGVLCLNGVAQQVITNCAEADLVAAIQKGGPILFACDGVISLSQPVVVTNRVQLDATGRNVVLDGRGSNRIFDIIGANVGFTNLIFSNSVARGQRAIVSTNLQTPAGDGFGGALNVVSSVVQIANCKFVGNQAIGGEGMVLGIWNSPVFFKVLLEAGSNSFGGAIFSVASSLDIQGSSFSATRALAAAPVPYSYPTGAGLYYTMPALAEGGAIFAANSVLKLTRTEFYNCQAGAGDAGGDGNAAPMRGGAVAARNSKFFCEESVFFGNTASLTNRGETAKGGAVYAEEGEAYFLRTLFSSNSAIGGRIGLGGTPRGGTGGGALWLSNSAVIQRCSFTSNFVKGGDSEFFNHAGGESPPDIGYGGAVASFGSLSVTNSTFAFNMVMSAYGLPGGGPAAGDVYGGAIYSAGSATVSFSTIASNNLIFKSTGGYPTTGAARGAGIFATNVSGSETELTLEGCVVQGNMPGNFATNLPVRIRDAGANISSDFTLMMTAGGSLTATNARLGGFRLLGETYGFFLRPDSPAIGRAVDITDAPPQDQLGFPRVVPDAGAIEWQGIEASLELRLSDPGEMRLDVRDPSYSLRLLEGSSDLENWTELEFNDYSPQVVSGREKRMFFRLR